MNNISSKNITRLLLTTPRFNYIKRNNSVNPLQQQVKKVINQREKQIKEINTNYLQKQRWSIKQRNNLVQLSKNGSNYQVNVVINPKVSLPFAKRQVISLFNNNQKPIDYCLVTVYWKINQSQQWLIADYQINEDRYLLYNVSFMKDIEKQKLQRVWRCNQISNYGGFYLNSFKGKIESSIKEKLNRYGFNQQFFEVIQQLIINTQQKNQLEWLKNLHQLLL